MAIAKVVEWVDIDAPRDDVYNIMTNIKRRLQLSPLWGITQVEFVSPDYPQQGSHYHSRIVQGDGSEYDAVITENIPPRKFSYQLNVELGTSVTWTFQETPRGTRLTYEEEFAVGESDGEEFTNRVREIVRQWLKNVKNYCELRGGAFRRAIRWLVDRYFLDLRPDQRRTVVTILVMHAIGFISFVMAALAMGVATLV